MNTLTEILQTGCNYDVGFRIYNDGKKSRSITFIP